jgi:hypothetical protein
VTMTAWEYLRSINCDFGVISEEQAINMVIESHRHMRERIMDEMTRRLMTPEGQALVTRIKDMSFDEVLGHGNKK